MSIVVQEFDIRQAEEELKKCPKIVREYVRILKDCYEREKQLTHDAIKKIKELAKQQ